jgi:hypothetical protein
MALRVVSMVLAVPAADCELITSAAKTRSLDTRLSQPRGVLVGISLLKLYLNEVAGLSPRPLRRGGAVATHWKGRERLPGYNLKIKHTLS